MFKGLGNLASLVKQAQSMGARMTEITEQLKTQRTKGAAGAGMVEVEVNGLGQVLSVNIDPALVANNDREMIQDLLPAAINQACQKARQMHMDAMRDLTGGLSLPGLEQIMAQVTQGQFEDDDGAEDGGGEGDQPPNSQSS